MKRFLPLATALVWLAGCAAPESSNPPPKSVAIAAVTASTLEGSWTKKVIDVPGDPAMHTEETWTFTADGFLIQKSTTWTPSAAPETADYYEDRGTWQINGSVLNLAHVEKRQASAAFTDNSGWEPSAWERSCLTVIAEGQLYYDTYLYEAVGAAQGLVGTWRSVTHDVEPDEDQAWSRSTFTYAANGTGTYLEEDAVEENSWTTSSSGSFTWTTNGTVQFQTRGEVTQPVAYLVNSGFQVWNAPGGGLTKQP